MIKETYEDCIRRSDVGLTDFEIIMCKDDYREALKILLEKIAKAPSVKPQEPQEKVKQEIKKNLDVIRAYLVEKVFQNPDIMFSKDREKIDLPEIIASLYECLHRAVIGEPYLYMFHWANKIGSDVDDQLFMEDEE